MNAHTNIFRFSLSYFILSVVLFIIEVLIAKYAGGWIRGFLGDVLVVILVYTAVKSVLKIESNFATNITIISTLIFACSVEFSQYFKLAELLGFAKGSIPHIVLGNTFSVADLACYMLGCIFIFLVERSCRESRASAKVVEPK